MGRTGSFSVNFKNRAMSDEDLLVYDEDDDWKFEDEEEENLSDGTIQGNSKLRDEADIEKQTSSQSVEINGIENELFVDHTLYDSNEHKAHIWNLDSKLGQFRFKIHLVMDHIVTRLFSILLVLVDIVLVLVALSTKASTEVYSPVTLAIVSYFMMELVLRMFAWGKEFFHHRLEIIDMVIIILTFITTVTFEIITIKEHLRYGKLIVTFRLLRILLLARIFTGKKHVERSTRNFISQNKRRYVKDGFDLDLTYVTERVVAMSFPSSGKTSMYRNPIEEVSRFFNTKHPGHYLIVNCCSERSYDTKFFNDSVERILIDDHNVPRLSQLLQFVHTADEYMKKDEKNVLAIHCKGGKGRTGTAVAAWLLYSGQFRSAEKALQYFGLRRTDRAKGTMYQGVETPSQSRYVGYLEKVLFQMNGRLPTPVPLMFKSLKITGLKHVGNGDGSDLRMEVVINGRVVHELNFNVPIVGKIVRKGDDVKIKFNVDDTPMISGDVKVKFHSSNPNVPKEYDRCAFFFWFHTSFIEHHKFHLRRHEIGNCHKKKLWKIYTEKFSLTLKFIDPPRDIIEGVQDIPEF